MDKMTLLDERSETIQELADLIILVQEMGRRLADETHGENHQNIKELNTMLHDARSIIMQLQQKDLQKKL